MTQEPTVGAGVRLGSAVTRAPAIADGLVMLLLALVLLWPAAMNTAPLLFFDSFGYLRSGEAAIDFAVGPAQVGEAGATGTGKVVLDTKGDGVQTSRSVYYGLPLAALYRISGSVWLAAVVQSLALASAIFLGLRRFGVQSRWRILAAGGALALVTGLAVFSSALMPDAFAGTAILSLAVIFGFSDRIRAPELSYWLALLFASLLFHKAHLATVLGLVVALALPFYLLRRVNLKVLSGVMAVCLLAGLSHVMVDVVVKRLAGSTAAAHPFVLARMIGDGTAVKYLDAHCGEAKFRLCRYKARMPMTEEEFLFVQDKDKGAYGAADANERELLKAESGQIITGVLREYAGQQVIASATNIVRQFFAVGVMEFGRVTGLKVEEVSETFRPVAENYTHSRVFMRTMPLAELSAVMLGAYALSLMGIVGLGVAALMRRLTVDPAVLAGLFTILAGLAANAAVTGAISGVFDRYQGRIAWLMAFCLIVAVAAVRAPKPRPRS